MHANTTWKCFTCIVTVLLYRSFHFLFSVRNSPQPSSSTPSSPAMFYDGSSTQSPHMTPQRHTPSTTLKPRSGKEYIDRKKFVETLNDEQNIFNFDTVTQCSSFGDGSPRSPSVSSYASSSRTRGEHDYVNFTPSTTNNSLSSPRPYECSEPGSPMSIGSEISNPRLNYAELDLSQNNGHRPVRNSPRVSDITYAQIDVVAMVAASKVGKEHAKHREDSLKRRDNRILEERRQRTSTGGVTKLTSSMRSGSKDRKFSAPS